MKASHMFSTLSRLAPLGLVLAAGLSLAQASSKPAVPPGANPIVTKKPQTCSDQCQVLEKACSNPCDKAKRPTAKTACKANCDQIVAACEGSCKEKGRIDADYMKEHIKPPKAPAAPRTK